MALDEASGADVWWKMHSATSPIDLDRFRRDPTEPKIQKIRFCASLARDILELLCFDGILFRFVTDPRAVQILWDSFVTRRTGLEALLRYAKNKPSRDPNSPGSADFSTGA